MPHQRQDVFALPRATTLAAVLAAAVVGLDVLWGSVEGSTGSLAYALVDEPAHLATCAIALLAVAAIFDSRLPAGFVLAALVASVAIDIDHLPGYLGWDGLAGSLPRPQTHSLLPVLLLLAIGLAAPRRGIRLIAFGVAFGLSAHLLRDLATGPGVSLAWPVSSETMTIPYAIFLITLALAVASGAPRKLLGRARADWAAGLAALALTVAAISPAVAPARTVSIGAYMSGADNNPVLIDRFNAQAGRQVAFLVSYKEWSQAPFVVEQLDGIWNHGAVPLITWEPVGVPLNRIARGDYDAYVREAADVAANWEKPLMLRFGQEMNGDWFTWGRRPAAFKAAWRHLVRVFRSAGADNVEWIWNPYVNSRGGRLPFVDYFPGNKWIDWAALNVINWGSPHPWRTFRQIIGGSYRTLLNLTSKPVMLAEVGSGELGGSKARWMRKMLRRTIPRMGHVRAVAFWSKWDSRGDLRVDSSEAALAALQGSLSVPLYTSSRRALLKTPARLGR